MESRSVNIHQALIERCRQGERKAQYELYKLYFKAMYNTALRIVGDPEDAQDILQESFIAAFARLDQYRADAAFGAWLKKIVINNSLNFLKKRKRMVEQQDLEDSSEYHYEWEDVPDHQMTVKEIKGAISQLPEGFRRVLTLYLLEGYDHKEIGQILGITESTSKSQYNRAKKKIRTMLNKAVRYG